MMRKSRVLGPVVLAAVASALTSAVVWAHRPPPAGDMAPPEPTELSVEQGEQIGLRYARFYEAPAHYYFLVRIENTECLMEHNVFVLDDQDAVPSSGPVFGIEFAGIEEERTLLLRHGYSIHYSFNYVCAEPIDPGRYFLRLSADQE